MAAWVDCVCGAEVEFSDLDDDGSMVTTPCDDCGRRIEISLSAYVSVRSDTPGFP